MGCVRISSQYQKDVGAASRVLGCSQAEFVNKCVDYVLRYAVDRLELEERLKGERFDRWAVLMRKREEILRELERVEGEVHDVSHDD